MTENFLHNIKGKNTNGMSHSFELMANKNRWLSAIDHIFC
jgi:hypothetical protein